MRPLIAMLVAGACGSGGGFPDAATEPPPPDPGTFSVQWLLTNGSGSAITCTQASATSVSVGIVAESTGDRFNAGFECGVGQGVSGPLPIATYDLDFSLLGGSGVIATGTSQAGVGITSDHTTLLPAVGFSVP